MFESGYEGMLKFAKRLDEEHSLASGIFLVTLFFAAEKRVTGSKGFGSKTIMDDGA